MTGPTSVCRPVLRRPVAPHGLRARLRSLTVGLGCALMLIGGTSLARPPRLTNRERIREGAEAFHAGHYSDALHGMATVLRQGDGATPAEQVVARYWTGRALAAMGRCSEAIAVFSEIAEQDVPEGTMRTDWFRAENDCRFKASLEYADTERWEQARATLAGVRRPLTSREESVLVGLRRRFRPVKKRPGTWIGLSTGVLLLGVGGWMTAEAVAAGRDVDAADALILVAGSGTQRELVQLQAARDDASSRRTTSAVVAGAGLAVGTGLVTWAVWRLATGPPSPDASDSPPVSLRFHWRGRDRVEVGIYGRL